MKIIIHPEYQLAQHLIVQLPNMFATKGTIIYAGRNVVKSFDTQFGEWVVKRYKSPNIVQKIAYSFFRKSKAERAYIYADKLLALGINTPNAIAYIEEKKYKLFNYSYFISNVCKDAPLYPTLVETTNYNKELVGKLAAFFVEMHKKGFLHGDPNLDNILYRPIGENDFSFTVIDTNRSVFKTEISYEACLDNLKRITHRRGLLQEIVEEYAKLRNWDIQLSIKRVMTALDKFERRRQLKRIIKWKA